jgi:hypothetical protein
MVREGQVSIGSVFLRLSHERLAPRTGPQRGDAPLPSVDPEDIQDDEEARREGGRAQEDAHR